MSHHHHHHGPPHSYPPNGPPPPYHGYPSHLHPPPGPSYAYVPAPMMPVPVAPAYPTYHPPQPEQPAPTYVTNYIYQQPEQPAPSPVHIVDGPAPQITPDPVSWIPSTTHSASQLSHKAVLAGKEPGWNSSPLWVIRAHHNGELLPGKLVVNDRRAYVPNGGKEVPVHNFEVLCAPAHALRWMTCSNGQVPVGAIPGGNTHTGETLYIGRVKHSRSVTPGKIHPSHGCLYISFGGSEIPHKNYEVLCRVVG